MRAVLGMLIAALVLAACEAPNYTKPEYQNAKARCHSLGGEFTWNDDALCYVDGEVV